MRKTIVFLLPLFLILLPIIYGQCVVPEKSLVITQDTLLCKGAFNLEEGIIIDGNNIELDCNNALLNGAGLSSAVLIENKEEIAIKNCNLSNFQTGINLKNTKKINLLNNNIFDNRRGISILFSDSIFITGNTIQNNTIDGILVHSSKEVKEDNNLFAFNPTNMASTYECYTGDDYCPNECNYEADHDCENSAVIETKEKLIDTNKTDDSIKENIPNDLSASILKNIATIRASDHEKANSAVKIEKTKTIKDGKTAYETRITALEDKKGLVLYEYFPKEAAEHVRDINFDETFILIEEDPIVKKEIGEMKKDEVVVITYNLDKAISGDTNPSSIVTIENSSRLINALANISYILALYLVLVLIKKYKADKMLKEFKTKTKKLLGVPFPIAYVALSIIPSINYRFLASETIAIAFYSFAIIALLAIIFMLAKEKE